MVSLHELMADSENSLIGIKDPFRRMVETVQDYGIFLLDPQGHVASWNPGAARIKGSPADEIIGEHFRIFYHEDARRKKWPEEELRRARELGRFEDEGPRIRKDGATFWANVVITPVHDHNGVLRGYAKVTRDLSERRRIENLESTERQTQEFLAMLAHELRNPLAPISNALTLLARKPTSDPMEIWVREVLQRQTAQLGRLVDDLLDVSRITRAALVLDRKPLDLRTILRQAADASMQWFEQKRQSLTIALSDERLVAEVDEVRLRQVVQNLLHHAAKYTPRSRRIELSARRDDADALISVRDNGIGMTPELLATAFDLFKQAQQGLDRTQGGLDVGLPKMNGYELAQQMRADPALSGALLVAVTGYGQMHDRARASASGFHHHLVKPVDFGALQQLLRETV